VHRCDCMEFFVLIHAPGELVRLATLRRSVGRSRTLLRSVADRSVANRTNSRGTCIRSEQRTFLSPKNIRKRRRPPRATDCFRFLAPKALQRPAQGRGAHPGTKHPPPSLRRRRFSALALQRLRRRIAWWVGVTRVAERTLGPSTRPHPYAEGV